MADDRGPLHLCNVAHTHTLTHTSPFVVLSLDLHVCEGVPPSPSRDPHCTNYRRSLEEALPPTATFGTMSPTFPSSGFELRPRLVCMGMSESATVEGLPESNMAFIAGGGAFCIALGAVATRRFCTKNETGMPHVILKRVSVLLRLCVLLIFSPARTAHPDAHGTKACKPCVTLPSRWPFGCLWESCDILGFRAEAFGWGQWGFNSCL